MLIDIIIPIVIIGTVLGGMIGGFGKVLKFFTQGIFGKIISVFVCYFIFGIVLDWPFVQDLLHQLNTSLAANGSWICTILIMIRIDLIVFAVALFVGVQLLRVLVVGVIDGIFETENAVVKVVGKTLGILLALFCTMVIVLIVFQILAWTTGVNGPVYQWMKGSIFGIDQLFVNNPLNSIFESIRQRFI